VTYLFSPRAPIADSKGMMTPDTKSTKKSLRATLADLSALHGAPGFEQPLVKYFQRHVVGLADRVDVDRYGNVTATKNGRQPHPRLIDMPRPRSVIGQEFERYRAHFIERLRAEVARAFEEQEFVEMLDTRIK
jgi:hypothetical protein